jgi:hypothetical protein
LFDGCVTSPLGLADCSAEAVIVCSSLMSNVVHCVRGFGGVGLQCR